MSSIIESLDLELSAKPFWILLLAVLVYILLVMLLAQKVKVPKKVAEALSVIGTLGIIAIWAYIVFLR